MQKSAITVLSQIQQGLQEHDAMLLMSAYATNTQLELIDTFNPPSQPLLLQGYDMVRAYWEEVCKHDARHWVTDEIVSPGHISFHVICKDADAAMLRAASICTLANNAIIHQLFVQVWDPPLTSEDAGTPDSILSYRYHHPLSINPYPEN